MMAQHRIHNTNLPKQITVKKNPKTQKNKMRGSLSITQAEAEAVIQPDRVLDDLGREAEAVIWIGGGPGLFNAYGWR